MLTAQLGAYASGRSDITGVLGAQQELLALRIQRVASDGDYVQEWANLENIVGHSLASHSDKSASTPILNGGKNED